MSQSNHPTQETGKPSGLPAIDVNEYGGKKDGVRQSMNRRLFMQLLVFDVPTATSVHHTKEVLLDIVHEQRIASVVYDDVNHPRGLALLTWSDNPSHFVRTVRPIFEMGNLCDVVIRPSFTMLGRTYGLGHEPDLPYALLERSVNNVMNEALPWHVWYPLRRIGAFARLSPEEQSPIMREHAQIGFAYGEQKLAHDVRLACYGLDAEDNEFVIGLVGAELHPLSHLVQTMRKTVQTSQYIEKMGPFFVGHVAGRVNP